MPTLSSLGAASAFGWHQNTPVVSGGILTADDTYYYRTFAATGAHALTVTGGQLKLDFLLVGAGGSGGYANITGTNYWNYNYHSYGTCNYSFGQCQCNTWYCTGCYWDYWGDYIMCDYRYNYYADNSEARRIFYGAGGGGGVTTGSIKLNPGNYPLQVGAPATGGGFNNGFFSYMGSFAFGIWAHGGGSGEPGMQDFRTGASLSGSTYSGNFGHRYGYDDAYLTTIVNDYKSGDILALTNADSSVEASAVAYGTAGGGNVNYNTPNRPYIPFPEPYDIPAKINYNWYTASTIDIIGFGGWGGGAGKGGQSQGKYASERVDANGNWTWTISSTTDMSSANYKPDDESGITATFLEQVYASRTFYDPSTGQVLTTNTKFGVWNNVNWGKGVEVMGLKVGGGGMTHGNARTLENSYGGGYPGDGSINGRTYSTTGASNTGGGGGTGQGGSGVIRVRYLRSAVGG